MKKKYYAVKKGYKTGIFESWDECKKQVIGYSGAIYKSFEVLNEALEYLGEKSIVKNINSDVVLKSDAVAYVDGSYDKRTACFSYGVVFFYNDEEKHFNEKFDDKDLAEMRNVAGEIKGAEKAMTYCVENGIKSVDIYYDYEGVARWCTGDWKANKEGTKAYKSFYDSIKNKVKVNFIKVMAHSGDKYNDLADRLAKEALGF